MSHTIRSFVLLLAMLCAATLVYAQVNNELRMNQRHYSLADEVLPRSLPEWKGEAVAIRKPDGLILSEGNLYFTSHDAAGAAVWRTAQTSIPGQEGVLYWEQDAIFGDIVFAQVDGIFWGYFFAEKAGTNFRGVMIKRVPLTGGTASVLANVGNNIDIVHSHRNLVTDGKNLYWQDDQFVRMMPIRGGAVTRLDPVTANTPTAGLALQDGNVLIYASVRDIRFIKLTGIQFRDPLQRTIVTAESRVTALHAVANGIYWGEENGTVKLKVGDTITTVTN